MGLFIIGIIFGLIGIISSFGEMNKKKLIITCVSLSTALSVLFSCAIISSKNYEITTTSKYLEIAQRNCDNIFDDGKIGVFYNGDIKYLYLKNNIIPHVVFAAMPVNMENKEMKVLETHHFRKNSFTNIKIDNYNYEIVFVDKKKK